MNLLQPWTLIIELIGSFRAATAKPACSTDPNEQKPMMKLKNVVILFLLVSYMYSLA